MCLVLPRGPARLHGRARAARRPAANARDLPASPGPDLARTPPGPRDGYHPGLAVPSGSCVRARLLDIWAPPAENASPGPEPAGMTYRSTWLLDPPRRVT